MINDFVKILQFVAVLSMFFAITACSDGNDFMQKANNMSKKQQQETLDSLNRCLVNQEKEAINDYIKKSGNTYAETGTGLRYRIVNQGDGELLQTGNVAVMDYESRLLDGDLLYSSAEDGNKMIVVGHGGVESGLEEALLHLHYGDEAEIIIPMRLAHGLIGDGKRIPPCATIVYKVKVIENQLNK